MGCCKKTLVVLLPVVIAYFVFCGDKFDPESVRGKRVLVTGASSGIGKQVAFHYAELGAQLVITARRKNLLEKVATKCKELGAQSVHFVPADMAVPADRKAVVEATEKQLGGLDILILNHAMLAFGRWKGSPENMTYLENMMNVNFHSFVDITSMLLNALKESQGNIGIVSSIAGKVGCFALEAYSAGKHALHGFYSSLRQELRFKNTGVSVTLIVYGPVLTEEALEKSPDIGSSLMVAMAGNSSDAADALVRGVSARVYEVYYPRLATVFKFLNQIVPGYLENAFGHMMPEELYNA